MKTQQDDFFCAGGFTFARNSAVETGHQSWVNAGFGLGKTKPAICWLCTIGKLPDFFLISHNFLSIKTEDTQLIGCFKNHIRLLHVKCLKSKYYKCVNIRNDIFSALAASHLICNEF